MAAEGVGENDCGYKFGFDVRGDSLESSCYEEGRSAYEQIDTSMNSALRGEMRSRSGGRHTVPQIFIDNEHIGDCEELFRLENAGHLDRLLRVS